MEKATKYIFILPLYISLVLLCRAFSFLNKMYKNFHIKYNIS